LFHKVVAYFTKEFYHWLAVCHNEAQRLGYGFVVELSARTFREYQAIIAR